MANIKKNPSFSRFHDEVTYSAISINHIELLSIHVGMDITRSQPLQHVRICPERKIGIKIDHYSLVT